MTGLRIITCSRCNRQGGHHGYGICDRCYQQDRRSAPRTPAPFPPAPTGAWLERALCAEDPKPFDDVAAASGPGHRLDRFTVEAARWICANCPVRVDCLDHALRVGEPDGLWGGLMPEERAEMRRVSE